LGDNLRMTVVIPTCNRPHDLARCLASVAQVTYPAWDVLVVDQSDDDLARDTVAQYAPRLPPLTYQRMSVKGASRARNRAIEVFSGEVLAFIDDDCTVEPDWLMRVADAFARHPRATIVCGAVLAAEHDPSEVLIPVTSIKEKRILHGPRVLAEVSAIMSASMYLRREALHQIGPFDEKFGPGAAHFRTGEDTDYVCRALLLGHQVFTTPEIKVTHYGARSFKGAAASQMIRIAVHSKAAVTMKLLRCGYLAALSMLAKDLARNISRIEWEHILNRKGPTGLAWMALYLRGLLDGMRLPIDRQRLIYRDPACMPVPLARG
jgi:GT2 family glycosyltransferase